MVSKHTIAIAMVVCAVATGGIAAGVYGAGVTAGEGDSASTDRATTGQSEAKSSAASELRAQQDGTTKIEPGETVTGEVNRSDESRKYVFEMEPGQRATITYTSTAPPRNDTKIWVETPDGRVLPEGFLSRVVSGGHTKTITFLTNEAGTATIHVGSTGTLRPEYGTYELSLEMERTGEVPDEPNDDRANATELELNATKSAELDGAEVDYYTFTLPDYRTPDYPHVVHVPVTVTVERERQDGVSVLNVGTTTRYVGTSNPASVQFVGTEGSQYYVAVANVNEGGGPYNLTVRLDESDVSGEPVAPDNGTQSLDEISQAAYGIPFEELSEPTSQLVQAVYDHQDSETKLSKDELAQMRYDMAFEELSEETRGEIATLYRAQFVGGQRQ